MIGHQTPRARARGSPRRGLSLIEVLLAMAIMLLSLVAIGQLVDLGSDSALMAQFQTRGTRLAQAKMAEVEAGVVPLQGASAGTFDEDPDWSWSVDPQTEAAPNLYRVTVKVSRDYRGRPFEVTLAQLVFDPSKMGSAAQAERPTTDPAAEGSGTTGGTGTTTGTGGMSP